MEHGHPFRADRFSLVMFLVLGFACHTLAQERMYWANDGNVYRSLLDGTQVELLLDSAVTGDSIYLIDFDPVDEHVYLYGNSATAHFVKRCNLDGSGVVTILDSGVPGIKYGFAIDPVNRKMYLGSHGAGPPHGMRWANLDGTQFEVIPPDPYYSHDIEVDPVNGKLYWTDAVIFNGLRRANLDGTNQENVFTGAGDLSNHIALDVANDLLYFSDSRHQTVRRMTLGGSAVETIVTGIPVEDIEIHAASGKLYWASETMIQRANFDGTNIEDLVALGRTGHGAGESLFIVVPEPATLVLFAVGFTTLCRRRT